MSVFVLCGQLLLFFRPKDSYEKYFKLIVNLMILLQFLTPFLSICRGEDGADVWLEEILQEIETGWTVNLSRNGDLGEEWEEELSAGEHKERRITIPSVEIADIEIAEDIKIEGDSEITEESFTAGGNE